MVPLTGLTAPTVYRIFTALAARGLLREVDEGAAPRDRRGRRPSFYALEPSAAYALGVDLSTREAVVLVVDLTGAGVHRTSVPIAGSADGDDLLERVAGACERALAEAAVPRERLLGVGIGAPGVVDIEAGVVTVCPRYPLLDGVPVAQRLGSRLGVPVLLHNNTSVIALAECRYGGATDERSAVAILLRAGVGGAFVQDGRAFVSHGTTALEVGRWMVDMGAGPMRTDVLEEYLSEDAILARVRAVDVGVTDVDDVVARLAAGDAAVGAVVTELAGLLGRAMVNIALLLKPEAFLLITRSRELSLALVLEIEKQVRPPDAPLGGTFPRLLALGYDAERACKGAADLVFDPFFATA